MGNLWINVRIGKYHIQIGPSERLGTWRSLFSFSIAANDFHESRGYPSGYFDVYDFFSYHKFTE
jgi:hypothetical protein